MPHLVRIALSLFLGYMEQRSEAKGARGSHSKIFYSYVQTDLWNPLLFHCHTVLLEGRKLCSVCVATRAWWVRCWDFSTFTTRLLALCLPNTVGSWHQTQKVMLSGFLLFFSLSVFSKDSDRWNNTLSAPCPCHNVVHLSKLQTLAIVCAFFFFKLKANYLHSEWKWQK